MKYIFKTLPFAAVVYVAFVAAAFPQDKPQLKNTNDLEKFLTIVNDVANGQEILVDGAIGTMFGETVYFVDQTGRYKILLDAGRDFRRKIEGCELELFDPSSSKCKVLGKAEVRVDLDDDNVADGVEISLILFAVESFERKD